MEKLKEKKEEEREDEERRSWAPIRFRVLLTLGFGSALEFHKTSLYPYNIPLKNILCCSLGSVTSHPRTLTTAVRTRTLLLPTLGGEGG